VSRLDLLGVLPFTGCPGFFPLLWLRSSDEDIMVRRGLRSLHGRIDLNRCCSRSYSQPAKGGTSCSRGRIPRQTGRIAGGTESWSDGYGFRADVPSGGQGDCGQLSQIWRSCTTDVNLVHRHDKVVWNVTHEQPPAEVQDGIYNRAQHWRWFRWRTGASTYATSGNSAIALTQATIKRGQLTCYPNALIADRFSLR
jgi:hypothetical protein